MSTYSESELADFGFAALGQDVRLSRKASIYGAARIAIGDNSRIDDFCVLSAGEEGIEIGRHVHIAVMCSLIGRSKIDLSDFCNLSSRVSIYSSSDDYSGGSMTNPTLPEELRGTENAPVFLGRHVIIGSGSVILPGSNLPNGVAVGALSLVKGTLERDSIYVGSPARRIGPRRTEMYQLEKRLDERDL